MKYCTKCGAELGPNARFCAGCGAATANPAGAGTPATDEEAATVIRGASPAEATPEVVQPAMAPGMAVDPAAGYPQQVQAPHPGYAGPYYRQPGYPPRAQSGSALIVFGWIAVVLHALHLYFFRYANRIYDDLSHNYYSFDNFRHRDLDLTSFYIYEALFVVAVVLAVIATLRTRKGARGLWTAIVATWLVANFLEIYGGTNDFYFSYAWDNFRANFGLFNGVNYQGWIARAGLLALVLTIVLAFAARRPAAPNGHATLGPHVAATAYNQPMGYGHPQPGYGQPWGSDQQ